MNSMYDLQQLLKKYGTFIYTGERLGDLELFELELKELYELNMIDVKTFQNGLIILKREFNKHKM